MPTTDDTKIAVNMDLLRKYYHEVTKEWPTAQETASAKIVTAAMLVVAHQTMK